MKRLFTLFFVVSVLSATVWAADVSYTEVFSKIGNLNNGTSDVYGDLCTWHRTLASHRAQDTILVKTRRAFMLPVAYTGKGKLETTDWEGGIKSVEFKFGRFGKENTNGRVLQLNVKAGTIENPTATYAKNAMKLSTGATPEGYETYSYAFNCKEQDAQLVIDNISTHAETLTENSSLCRILVADIVVTPYILYTQKEATIGSMQHGYVNKEYLDNSEGATLTYYSSNTSIAKVDATTGVVTPVSEGEVQIYAALAEGARTHYTLHVVDGIVAENFSKVVQTGAASDATWHGDLFDWKANAARRGTNDTIKGRPIERQQATWFSSEGYVESKAAVEGGIKNVSFTWRQWSTKATGTTTKIAVSYGGEEKAYQEYSEMAQNASQSFNEDINCASNSVLKIQNKSYNTSTSAAFNNRIVIENVKITPYLLYTTKEATLDTRNTLTYTNTGLINNTTGDAPTYEISPANAAVSINAEGQVAVEDGAEVNKDFTVTATWGAVTTTYTLHIISRTSTTASYENAVVRFGLGDAVPANTLTKTEGYDGTITYSSSNTAVATVASNGTVSLAGGVGQTTITATLPQTDGYEGTTASYTIYVRDNDARVENFSEVEQTGIVGNTMKDWTGDLFTWQAQYQVRRGTNDTIHAGTTKHQGTSIGIQDPTGTPISSILQSKDAVEGGIKHLSFYWMQWGAAGTNCTRRIAVYAGETLIGYQNHPNGASGRSGDEYLLGINNAMKSNKQLIIKNESYKGSVGTLADNNCRIVLDNIYITPWLLYTNKAAQEITIGSEYTNTSLINNTAGETGTLTFSSSDESIATVDGTGKVKGKAPGNVKITAKFAWSVSEYVTTTYTIAVVPATNCETFANISKMCVVAPGANKCSETPVTDELNNGICWTYWLGGGNTAVFGREALYLRARLTSESSADYGYLRSGKIPGGLSSLTFAWNQGGTETGVTYNVEVKVNGDIVGTITAAGQSALYATPQMFTVSELDYKGNVVIEIVNKTAYDGDKSRGRMVIDYIYWTSNAGAISLDETADNGNVLSWNAGGAAVDVNTNRSLVADNWNTLCLPFNISKNADLGGADVQELYSAERDGDDLVVGFKALNGDELVAGTPYLVMPTSNINLTGFTDKQVILIPSAVNKGIVTLTGIFSPKALIANDKTTLFVGTPDASGNNLFYPSANGNLNGMRAYFKIDTGSSAPIRRARFVTSQTDTATGVDSQKSRAESSKAIVNGQLIIIRNGDFYDVLGRKL